MLLCSDMQCFDTEKGVISEIKVGVQEWMIYNIDMS